MSVKSFMVPRSLGVMVFLFSCFTLQAVAQQAEAGAQASGTDSSLLTLKTTVRRVVVDVVVTDSQGNAVPGLTKEDFSIAEDGVPQTALSFEGNGFEQGMDYLPPKLPPEPANTFVNLPATPEKGPLYVLLYDLVNMDNEDQMLLTTNQHEDQVRGRQQLVRFIENKPEGARFAIFTSSDGLHLIQGFTSDKAQLFAAVDPASSRAHIPKVFLMGENTGRADPHAALDVLDQIGAYLDGLPGRKNLIWFSGTFPLSFSAGKDDGPNYIDQVNRTLNMLVRDQIAIYPVDVRGVVLSDFKSTNGITEERNIVSDRQKGAPGGEGPAPGTQAAAAQTASAGGGESLLNGSYSTMDQIARITGGRAFYSNNDVSAELKEATETGTSYYTLTYSPTDRKDGKVRAIHIELSKKGYRLAYRRTYYSSATGEAPGPSMVRVSTTNVAAGPKRQADDTLDAYMKHGAPMAHQLIFGAHVRAVGTPAKGTVEQMAQLAAAQGSSSRKNVAAKALPRIALQRFAIDYTVMSHQLKLQDGPSPMNLELAAAAYDSDGKMLNALVNVATDSGAEAGASTAKVYRAEQEMDVPLAATSIRVAVQDANTGRVGAMEIQLPLAPEK